MERNQFTPEQEKWLQALESGEWRQCRGNLHKDGAHCCLGVLLKVLDEPDPADRFNQNLTEAARDRAFMRGVGGKLMYGRFWNNTSLARANDDGASFLDIAAFIRANPWQVFTNFDAPEGQ